MKRKKKSKAATFVAGHWKRVKMNGKEILVYVEPHWRGGEK